MHNSTMIRLLQAKMAAAGGGDAAAFARANFGPNSAEARILEKAIIGSDALDGDTDFRAAQRGFLELVRNRSLIGQINAVSGFRKTPFEVPNLTQSSAPVAAWTAEGALVPVAGTSFARDQLSVMKISSLLVETMEIMRGAGADFESALSRDMVRGVSHMEGATFIDPSNSGVPGESPASVTNGVTPTEACSGLIKDDIEALAGAFSGDFDTAVLCTSPKNGIALHGAGFEGAGARGGEVAGIPLVCNRSVPSDIVVLLDPAGILLADDGIDMDIARHATLELERDSNDDPVLISLWQENLVGVMIHRRLNWKATRPGSVAVLSGCSWSA